ncbi:glycosyltransferase family 4 protein [Haloarcula amylovorans]|uniref:glycosyltransferase family 4 protein n=1 Tax=Haloarcula amylovorans TaxID=2562280 RepID=UPI001075FDB1|nr:glycosyltransferase family 4 protein [Halomicroarcula amylolytica]
MRILRVAQKLYPEVPGGGTYHVHAMSRDQAARGHDVTVLTVTDDPDRPKRERRDGYTIVRRPRTVSLLGNDLSAGVARFLRTAAEFDVVHAHSHLYASTNLAALGRRFGETPLAITNHGLYSQNAPEWLFDLYLRTAGRWTFDQADVVFCYTDEDRSRVWSFGVDSPIEVVANGVDTDRFTPDGPTSDRLDHDESVILFVGRLVDGKRPQDAVQMMSQLPRGLNARLYVVGDGPMRAELMAMAGDEVTFLGQLSYDEMPAVYRAADALVLPSRAEGLPRTILEAFASGVPVVSSRLEHTASIVEQAGETVPLGDVVSYGAAVERVLSNRERLASRGRALAVDSFQWQDTVAATTARLQSLL